MNSKGFSVILVPFLVMMTGCRRQPDRANAESSALSVVRYDMTGVGLPDLSNIDLAGFDVSKVSVLNIGGRTFNVRELYSNDEGIRSYTLQLAGEGAVVGFNCALSTSVLPGFTQTATSTISVCSGAYEIGFPATARQFVVNGNTVDVGNNRVYAFQPNGRYSVVR